MDTSRFFDLSPDLLCIASPNGHFLRVNPSWTETLGYDEATLLATPYYDLLHPDDVASTRDAILRLQQDGQLTRFENRYRHRNGAYIWLSWTSVRDEHDLIYGIARDIGYRKQYEAELFRRSEEISSLLSSITDAFMGLDDDWRFTYVNRQAEVLLHKSAAELLGRKLWDPFPEAFGSTFHQQYELAIREQQTVSFVEYYPPLETWFEVRAYPADRGISIFFRNVNAQRAMEAALRKREDEFRALVENNPDMIARFDTDLRYVYVNPALERVAEIAAADLLGKRLEEVGTSPETAAYLNAQAQWVIDNGQENRFEFEFLTPSGVRDFEARLTPEFGDDGRVQTVLSITRDMTQQKAVQRALYESETRYRALVENNPDLVARFDRKLRHIYVNTALVKAAGIAGENYLGRSNTDLGFPADVAAYLDGRMHAVFETGDEQWVEFEYMTSDGLRHFESRLTPELALDGGVQSVLSITRDITERKLAEKRQHELIAELEARTAELERFTYTVSHDLKSPLITIRGFIGLLEQDIARADSQRIENDLAFIKDAAGKMQDLLDDLLELSRIGRLVNPPERVDLVGLIDEVLGLLAGPIGARGAEVVVDPVLPALYGDKARLREVFQNLIENAVKFMGDQPLPRIEIGQRDAHDPAIYVADNGIGIDPRYHQKVFGLFEQLQPSEGGTGIGLALVKRIVEVHGGRVWVESAGVGHGSRFCMTLPLAQEQQPS